MAIRDAGSAEPLHRRKLVFRRFTIWPGAAALTHRAAVISGAAALIRRAAVISGAALIGRAAVTCGSAVLIGRLRGFVAAGVIIGPALIDGRPVVIRGFAATVVRGFAFIGRRAVIVRGSAVLIGRLRGFAIIAGTADRFGRFALQRPPKVFGFALVAVRFTVDRSGRFAVVGPFGADGFIFIAAVIPLNMPGCFSGVAARRSGGFARRVRLRRLSAGIGVRRRAAIGPCLFGFRFGDGRHGGIRPCGGGVVIPCLFRLTVLRLRGSAIRTAFRFRFRLGFVLGLRVGNVIRLYSRRIRRHGWRVC